MPVTVNIVFKNTDPSDSIKKYIQENIDKLAHFLREENTIHVEFEADPAHKSGPFYRAEITIMPKSEIYAEAFGNDFFEAVDLLMPKIKEQLVRLKEKRVTERNRQGSQMKDIESEVFNAE